MRTRGPGLAALLVLTAGMLCLPAPAGAAIYQRVLGAYEAHGSVPACEFSSPQLEAALRGIDTYGAQYFADFTQAVEAALAERASGECLRHRGTGSVSAGAGLAAVPRLPPSVTSSGDGGLPAPLLLMGILTMLALAAAGGGSIARRSGWEPSWLAAWNHALAEAGYRLDLRAAGLLAGGRRLRGYRASRRRARATRP